MSKPNSQQDEKCEVIELEDEEDEIEKNLDESDSTDSELGKDYDENETSNSVGNNDSSFEDVMKIIEEENAAAVHPPAHNSQSHGNVTSGSVPPSEASDVDLDDDAQQIAENNPDKAEKSQILIPVEELLAMNDRSELFASLFDAQESKDVQVIATKFIEAEYHHPLEATNFKQELVKLVMYSLQCPKISSSQVQCWSESEINDAAVDTLNWAQLEGEEMPNEAGTSFEKRFSQFFYYQIGAASENLESSTDTELDYLQYLISLCSTLMFSKAQFIRNTGASMLSGIIRGVLVILKIYTDKFEDASAHNESELSSEHRKTIQVLLKHYRAIECLLLEGVRDVFEPVRLKCYYTLVSNMKKYHYVLLNEKNLKLLKMLLCCSTEIYMKKAALKHITSLAQNCFEDDLNVELIDAFLSDIAPHLFLSLKIAEENIYELAFQLLLTCKRRRLMSETKIALLDSTLFVHLLNPENPELAEKAGKMFKELHDKENILVALAKFIFNHTQDEAEVPSETCIAVAVSAVKSDKSLPEYDALKESLTDLADGKHKNTAHILIVVILEALKLLPLETKTELQDHLYKSVNSLFKIFKNNKSYLLVLVKMCQVMRYSGSGLIQKLIRFAKNDCNLFAETVLNYFTSIKELENCLEVNEWSDALANEIKNFRECISNLDERNALVDFSSFKSALKCAEMFPTKVKCKTLVHECAGILDEVFDKIPYLDENEILIVNASAIEANVFASLVLMTKTEKLCRKNYPEGPKFHEMAKSVKKLAISIIDCMQDILRLDCLAPTIRIQVLSHLFQVLSSSSHIEKGDTIEADLICKSMEELIFQPSSITLDRYEDKLLPLKCLHYIVNSSNCFDITFKISATFISALSNKKQIQDLVLIPVKRMFDDKRVAKLLKDNSNNCQPFRLILTIFFYNFEQNKEKNQDACVKNLKKAANALIEHLPHSGPFKEAYFEFCSQMLLLALDDDRNYRIMLRVAKVFLSKLSKKHLDEVDYLLKAHNNEDESTHNSEMDESFDNATQEAECDPTLNDAAVFEPPSSSTPAYGQQTRRVHTQSLLHSIDEKD